ncbi:MAG TPA: stalk domain-containing protein [Syntrophomonadaceae bacterium]|nr:stalk domain-containing protein [Syntrophomonadaceae bacterium]
MKKSPVFFIFIGLIIAMLTMPALAAPPLTVKINGSVVDAPSDMDIIEGQVMVPLGWAAKQLEANSVEWDSQTQTITIKTGLDFYSLEKLSSYAIGLEKDPDLDRKICPLPDKAKNLNLSSDVPNRDWVLELKQFEQGRLTLTRMPPDQSSINICITSNDGSYEHNSAVYSIENHQDHYYLPMDWLEYLFHAKVDYNEAANILSIQTPDLDKIKTDITLIEDTLIPASADEAIELWGRGEQIRNGALQYAALSPRLRQEADKSCNVRQSYWVTGGSSPWVGPITIKKRDKLSDTKIEYTLSFPEITSDPPNTIATEKIVVEKIINNGQEGWFITQLLQSSAYGIIGGPYQSDSIYLTNSRISLPLPSEWGIMNNQIIITDEQDHIIGAFEELGGYFLPNHSQTLSDKTVAGTIGEGRLLLLSCSTPAASTTQESWQEVHAMLPLKNQHWLDLWVKAGPGEDTAKLQKILEYAILGASYSDQEASISHQGT